MIAQGIILDENKVLMVRQFVMRGALVWNFPGGGIEDNESPEEACIRELKEETGFDVRIVELLCHAAGKYTFMLQVTGGEMRLDKENAANEDLTDLAWVGLEDEEKFDKVTDPIRQILISGRVRDA